MYNSSSSSEDFNFGLSSASDHSGEDEVASQASRNECEHHHEVIAESTTGLEGGGRWSEFEAYLLLFDP